jgi:hypothetical protein
VIVEPPVLTYDFLNPGVDYLNETILAWYGAIHIERRTLDFDA